MGLHKLVQVKPHLFVTSSQMWKYSKADNPTVLILVPTRELVVQVTEILENLTENMTAQKL